MKHNEIYIELHESRFYYPGESIKGQVILDLVRATRTKYIHVTFSGEVRAGGRTCSLFTQNYVLYDHDKSISNTLEAQKHQYPFEISIPGKPYDLPSTLQLNKLGGVHYKLVAIHGKPLLPESLSPQFKIGISILERIRVDLYSLSQKTEVKREIAMAKSSDPRKVRISLQIPVSGIVRGDVLSVKLCIQHFYAFSREKSVKIQLIRKTFMSQNSEILEKSSLLTHELDLDIAGSADFFRMVETSLRIPASTPPTVGNSGRILSVEYLVRAVINLNNAQDNHSENIVVLDIPITVGTFPKPDIAIEIEEDEEASVDEEKEEAEEEEEETQAKEQLKPRITTSSLDATICPPKKGEEEIEAAPSLNTTEKLDIDLPPLPEKDHVNYTSNATYMEAPSPYPVPTRSDTILSSTYGFEDQSCYSGYSPHETYNSHSATAFPMPSRSPSVRHNTEPFMLSVPNGDQPAPGTPHPMTSVKRTSSCLSYNSHQSTYDDQSYYHTPPTHHARPIMVMPSPQHQHSTASLYSASPASPFMMIRPQMPSAYPDAQQYNEPTHRTEHYPPPATEMPSASNYAANPWAGY